MTRQITTLLVTGGSRGFGRAAAFAWNEHVIHQCQNDDAVKRHVHYVLVARNRQGLEETKRKIVARWEEAMSSTTTTSPSTIEVSVYHMDLEQPDEDAVQRILDHHATSSHDHIIFINNAGSLGPVQPAAKDSHANLKQLQQLVSFNVTSACWLSSRLVEHVQGLPCCSAMLDIVNVSSLVAIKPTPYLSWYSAGKAARDSFHATLALEVGNSKNTVSIRILNYAPGPLETDMMTEMKQHMPDLPPNFADIVLDPMASARKMVRLLTDPDRSNAFASGAHVDYYDLPDPGS